MAQSHVGTAHSSASAAVTVPPPSSLCPVCQQVEVDARQYRIGRRELVMYACDNGHEWATQWAVQQ